MEREAVTTKGRTSKTTATPQLPAGISCENWTGSPPSQPLSAAPSSAPAGLATPGRRAARRRPRGRGPARPRRAAGRRRGAPVRARRRDPRGGGGVPPAPLIGHCSGATTLEVFGDREGFSLHPLMTVPERGAAVRGRRLRGGRHVRPRARSRARALATRAADDRRRGPRRGPRRLPRRRLDRRQLPRHARGRGGAARRHRRRPRELLSRSPAPRWRTGPRNGAEQALTGPVARGDEATIARQREAIEQRAPDLLERVRRSRRRIAGTGGVMRTIRTVAELRAHLGATPAASASSRPWAPSTPATSR